MDRILVSTVVYSPPEDVFPYLRSFTDYPKYADHLREVRERGSGEAGPRYDLTVSWWKLTYTAASEVTTVDEPDAIRWRLVEDIDAEGEWRIEAAPDAVPAVDGGDGDLPDTASRVYFEAVYDPHSADEDAVSLPRFVSIDWVIRKVRPKLVSEAERIVARLVEDVEGERRDVELTVHEAP